MDRELIITMAEREKELQEKCRISGQSYGEGYHEGKHDVYQDILLMLKNEEDKKKEDTNAK